MLKKESTKGWTKKSVQFLTLATEGDASAQYEIGLRYLKGIEMPENHKKAIDWLIKSSNQGFEDAQYLLGTCYENGYGVDENMNIALGFYTKAAKAANKFAQHALGEYYFSKEKYDAANEWYRRAARQEHAPSQFEIGRCYFYGIGSIKAEEQAITWLEKAANRNYKPAVDLLRKIERDL